MKGSLKGNKKFRLISALRLRPHFNERLMELNSMRKLDLRMLAQLALASGHVLGKLGLSVSVVEVTY